MTSPVTLLHRAKRISHTHRRDMRRMKRAAHRRQRAAWRGWLRGDPMDAHPTPRPLTGRDIA